MMRKERIVFLVTDEEKDQIHAEARALGVSVGDYVRSRIFGAGPRDVLGRVQDLERRVAALENAPKEDGS
jgi:hypothetical protein